MGTLEPGGNEIKTSTAFNPTTPINCQASSKKSTWMYFLRWLTFSVKRNHFLCSYRKCAEMSIHPLYVGHGHGSSSGMLLYNWLICGKSCEISTSLRFHDKCNRYTVRRSVLPARKNNHVALVIDWQWGRPDLTQGSESMFCLSILETIDYIQMHFDFCNRAYFCMYIYTQKYRVFTLPLIVVQKSLHHVLDNPSGKNPSDVVDRIRNTFSNWDGVLMAGWNPAPLWTSHV